MGKLALRFIQWLKEGQGQVVLKHLIDELDQQRGHLFGWVPIGLGLGIGLYFHLKVEPSLSILLTFAILGIAASLLVLKSAPSLSPILLLCILCALGFSIAGLRANWVAGPVLEYRYYGPITGRLINIDRSFSDKIRLTLDQVHLDRMAPDKTPKRVRISLHGDQRFITLAPGMTLMTTGHLSQPSGPVEPGGFDFQRHSWFIGLGGLGYTRVPALELRAPEKGSSLAIFRARKAISRGILAGMQGREAGFAAAIAVGDRANLDQETVHALRDTNLAHLLAISGLHMGLLTGFVFTLIRLIFASVPYVALRLPIKKIAASCAMIAAFAYLLMSGASVATERAFIMVMVMLGAILVNRRAISLRAVALAATIVLILRPESLVSPGFQMSFAATTALVAVFGAWRNVRLPETWPRLPKFLQPIIGVAASSAIAGLATAPFGAAHFNQIAQFGLIANLASVPVMGLIVMPGAVLAGCLAPFGGAWIGLWVMKIGISWILSVAEFVAAMDGAVTYIPRPDTAVLPILSLGMLFLIVWRGRVRWLGVGGVMAAILLWFQVERPQMLVSESGNLFGLMSKQGRILSHAKGDGFVASAWPENDGDGLDQSGANNRAGLVTADKVVLAKFGSQKILITRGKYAPEQIAQNCHKATISILAQKAPEVDGCRILGRAELKKLGSLSIKEEKGELVILGAKQATGRRLWTR
ncbi:competence protein [Rhodobacteraceae bacterium HTCC2150]|nr:competence protein [Rhodobacteraceae bacterium HTCC2150]